jgi:hypothetical protein
MINTLEAGLLLVSGGVILNAIVGYSHSRKIQYLEKKMNEQEQQLQQAISEVKTAFEGFKTRTDATIAALEEKNANTPQIDLTDEIAELKSISASMSGTVETLPETAPDEGAAEEAPGESDSVPTGEAAPEGEAPIEPAPESGA